MLGQCGPGSNSNEGVLGIPHSSGTGDSPLNTFYRNVKDILQKLPLEMYQECLIKRIKKSSSNV